MELYFLNEAVILKNQNYFLDEKSSHHCVKVLRKKNGDNIFITNGRGQKAECTIVHNSQTFCEVFAENVFDSICKKNKIGIAISLLKNEDRLEWFLEKATELSVTDIYLLRCKHTEKQNVKFVRAQQIIISAMLQSQQVFSPQLHEVQDFDFFIKNTPAIYENKWLAHCSSKNEKTNLIDIKKAATENHLVLIGPEGDFSQQEIEQAKNYQFDFLSLGTNRLRAETAAIYCACFFFNQ